jgi:hypothetical protein
MFSANSFTPTTEETAPATLMPPPWPPTRPPPMPLSWHTRPPPMQPRDPQHPPTAEEIADAAATTRAEADVASTAIKEATVVMEAMHEAGASPKEMLAVALDAKHVAQKCAERAVRAAKPVCAKAGMASCFMLAVSPAIKDDPFSERKVAMTMANEWAEVANRVAAQVAYAAAQTPLPTPPSA